MGKHMAKEMRRELAKLIRGRAISKTRLDEVRVEMLKNGFSAATLKSSEIQITECVSDEQCQREDGKIILGQKYECINLRCVTRYTICQPGCSANEVCLNGNCSPRPASIK